MNINQFLSHKNVRVNGNGKRYSHVSLNPPSKYLIEESNIDQFWTLYCAECHDKKFTIGEKPQMYMPIICDVDIKMEIQSQNDKEKLYDEEMVYGLIQIYQMVLFEIIDNLKEDDFLCCVLEKDYYIIEKNEKLYKKNGFHLHFPKIFLSRYAQEKELMPRIIQELKKKNITNKIIFEKCIDTNYCKGAPWLLYGSSKGNDHNAYELSYCVDYNLEKIHFRKGLISYNIYNELEEKINFTDCEIDFYLPRIMSIILFHRNEYKYELKSNLQSINPMVISKQIMKNTTIYSNDEELNLSLIKKLLDILEKSRYEDRNEWILIGWILYNITDGTEQGYELWKYFSEKSEEKFDESICIYEWNRMKKKDLTIGSLKYLAKLDNPKEYNEIISENMRPFILKSLDLNGSHNDLAKALFQKYDSEFVCASIQNKIWYQYHHHIWKKLEEGITLRQKISNEIVQMYFDTLGQLNEDLKHYHAEEEDKLEKKTQNKIKVVMKLISHLKSAPFKNNIMREAMEVFYNESFMKKLDSDPYLIAFQNGVYDLQTHEFRDGRPSDYLSLKMNISYSTEYTMNHPDVENVLNFFTKIFPDVTLKEYFLDMSSEVFIGGNHSKIFQIWTGEGDNGKSITQLLFEKMLGPYSIKLPTSLITGKRTQSSCACPELVRAGNGVRLATLQEPDQKDTINIGILKELSGNDTFFARGLYKEGTEITPMFKLVLICNEPPKLPYNDRATWNRIRVIPFESTFTDEAPETFEEQLLQKKFPKDKDFGDKIPKMLEPFAWLLLNRLKYRKKIIIEPEKVKMATSDYRKKNDIYKQFIDEFILINENSQISLIELYSVFKDWYKDSMPNCSNNMPTKNELKEYFIKIWGNPIQKIYWKGFEIRNIFDSNKSLEMTTIPL